MLHRKELELKNSSDRKILEKKLREILYQIWFNLKEIFTLAQIFKRRWQITSLRVFSLGEWIVRREAKVKKILRICNP